MAVQQKNVIGDGRRGTHGLGNFPVAVRLRPTKRRERSAGWPQHHRRQSPGVFLGITETVQQRLKLPPKAATNPFGLRKHRLGRSKRRPSGRSVWRGVVLILVAVIPGSPARPARSVGLAFELLCARAHWPCIVGAFSAACAPGGRREIGLLATALVGHRRQLLGGILADPCSDAGWLRPVIGSRSPSRNRSVPPGSRATACPAAGSTAGRREAGRGSTHCRRSG